MLHKVVRHVRRNALPVAAAASAEKCVVDHD